MTSLQVELTPLVTSPPGATRSIPTPPHLAHARRERRRDRSGEPPCGDEADKIAAAVREALERTGAVITTGGLGPTSDDLTKPAIARIFGREMKLDEAMAAKIEERWRARFPNSRFPATNRTQAEIPEGARILTNRHGTAPGIWLEDDRGRWVAMMPGVPREMRGMLAEELLPAIKARSKGEESVVLSGTLRTTGIAESAIADLLGSNFLGEPGSELGSLPLAYLQA